MFLHQQQGNLTGRKADCQVYCILLPMCLPHGGNLFVQLTSGSLYFMCTVGVETEESNTPVSFSESSRADAFLFVYYCLL